MGLEGKVAFITGAAQGIGKGCAEALLERGAKVFFGDVNSAVGSATLKEFEERFGKDKVRFVVLDVTNKQQFQDAFSQAVSEFGQVDIMFNNAGTINEPNYELVININFIGTVTGTRLATEHMRKDKGGRGGRIVNMSSIAGLENFLFSPVYAGTKHAVRAYTSSLAVQPNIEQQGVEYGSLCPDAVDTDLVSGFTDEKINFLSYFWEYCPYRIPVSAVVDAFLDLLQLEKMNGAILLVDNNGKTYRKLAHHEV